MKLPFRIPKSLKYYRALFDFQKSVRDALHGLFRLSWHTFSLAWECEQLLSKHGLIRTRAYAINDTEELMMGYALHTPMGTWYVNLFFNNYDLSSAHLLAPDGSVVQYDLVQQEAENNMHKLLSELLQASEIYTTHRSFGTLKSGAVLELVQEEEKE